MIPRAPSFLLQTLGDLRLRRVVASDVEPIDVLQGGKPLALLAYLSLEGRRPIDRTVLIDLLWGEVGEESGRASLRQAVFNLRRVLGDDVILSDRVKVSLAARRVRTDVALATEAESAGDLEQYLRHYRGPFLSHPPVNGSQALERWVESVRAAHRRTFAALLGRTLTSAIAEGATERAVRLARDAAAVEPLLEDIVGPCADVLLSAGAFGEARGLLESVRNECARLELPLPSSVISRLTRMERAGAGRSQPDTPAEAEIAPGQEFVGREEALARLFRAFEGSRGGTSARVEIIGPAGIGKSRLLDEFEVRLRARGARVARVRFLAGMRQIPYAGLSELVRVVSAMPGALGVSEETASVLVELLPDLRNRYTAAAPRSPQSDDVLRERVRAVADLLATLCEDRSMVLLRDDEQYVDAESQRVLAAVAEQQPTRLLDVVASRTGPMPTVDAEIIELGPLSAAEVRTLLGRADSTDAATASLVARLELATGGIPQLVMLHLRSLVRAEVLRYAQGGWTVAAGATDRILLESELPLLEQVRILPREEGLALRVLSLWRRSVSEEELRRILHSLEAGASDAAWRHALLSLEGRGFVTLRNDAWVVAHDLIVNASITGSHEDEREIVLRAFALLSLPDGVAAVVRLEQLMQVFGAQGALTPAVILLRRAMRNANVKGSGLRGRLLAARLAAMSGRPEWQEPFDRALGWWERRRSGERVVLSAVGSALLVLSSWLLWMLQPRLVVEAVPMAETAPGGIGFVVQPRIGAYDGFGRALDWLETEVTVSANRGTVGGDSARALDAGRLQFEKLAVLGFDTPGEYRDELILRFRSAWWVRGVEVRPSGQQWSGADAFRLIRANVEGESVDSSGAVTLRAGGDSLTVVVTYEFTTMGATANYVVGVTPNWGDPRTSGIRLAGLPRPVHAGWQSAVFTVSRPERPGVYHLVFAMAAEGSAEHLLSQTNWTAGEPVWGDGNDLANLPLDQVERLRREKHVETLGFMRGTYRTRLGALWLRDSVPDSAPFGETRGERIEVLGDAIAIRVP